MNFICTTQGNSTRHSRNPGPWRMRGAYRPRIWSTARHICDGIASSGRRDNYDKGTCCTKTLSIVLYNMLCGKKESSHGYKPCPVRGSPRSKYSTHHLLLLGHTPCRTPSADVHPRAFHHPFSRGQLSQSSRWRARDVFSQPSVVEGACLAAAGWCVAAPQTLRPRRRQVRYVVPSWHFALVPPPCRRPRREQSPEMRALPAFGASPARAVLQPAEAQTQHRACKQTSLAVVVQNCCHLAALFQNHVCHSGLEPTRVLCVSRNAECCGAMVAEQDHVRRRSHGAGDIRRAVVVPLLRDPGVHLLRCVSLQQKSWARSWRTRSFLSSKPSRISLLKQKSFGAPRVVSSTTTDWMRLSSNILQISSEE